MRPRQACLWTMQSEEARSMCLPPSTDDPRAYSSPAVARQHCRHWATSQFKTIDHCGDNASNTQDALDHDNQEHACCS